MTIIALLPLFFLVLALRLKSIAKAYNNRDKKSLLAEAVILIIVCLLIFLIAWLIKLEL